MDKNLQRAMYGPSVFEVIVGVMLSLTLGVLLAVIWLIVKPVTTLKEPSSEAIPNMVYYIPGESNNTTSRTWMRKRQLLAEGQSGEITLTEAELNAWAAATLKPPAPNDASTVVPGQLNFRVRDGVMQISSPTTFNVFGMALPVVFQTRGDFRKSGDSYSFHPESMYIGSLAVHSIPGLIEAIMRKVSESQPLPEDIEAAWKKFSNVSINAEMVHITLP